jgi:hypothetical protein
MTIFGEKTFPKLLTVATYGPKPVEVTRSGPETYVVNIPPMQPTSIVTVFSSDYLGPCPNEQFITYSL